MSNLSFISFAASMDAVGVADVDAGVDTICAQFNNGKASCWGRNSNGELGLERAEAQIGDAAAKISTLTFIVFRPTIDTVPIIMISSGTSSCALFATGGIICWGSGLYGQLGTDETADVGKTTGSMSTLGYIRFSDTVPAGFIQSGRFYFNCAVFVNGRVRCWGYNNSEQLGDGTLVNRGDAAGVRSISNVPYITFAPSINTLAVKTISAGDTHVCALFYNGRSLCWGARGVFNLGKLGTLAPIESISSCPSASCLPLSSAGFISFSDNATPIVRVDVGDDSTCGN
jgi:alpha-tubulin suppressor-like RCC1 family protein